MSEPSPRRGGRYARGLWMLARGRPEAFALLGGQNRDYLNSLAPLVAFMIVIGAVEAVSGHVVRGVGVSLSSLCGLLAPPVIAEPLARRWGCMDRWALFANLLNWLTILMAPVLALAVIIGVLLAGAGLPVLDAAAIIVVSALCYVTWLQWFAARRGLGLSRWRAVQLLVAIQIGTGLLALVQVNPDAGSLLASSLDDQLNK